MKKNYSLRVSLLTLIAMGAMAPVMADDYFDDIYYNPNKPAKETKKSKSSGAYIANFDQMDVDTYNRRGQYYISPVDTIGSRVENGEDFVYTQQIQKFYNPQIVVDNSDMLVDVLRNSYGNVDVVYSFGGPSFAPIFVWDGWGLGYPYYPWRGSLSWAWSPSSYWSWNWAPSWTWGWGWSNPWAYGPSFAWSWGPWGPSWAPGYGPGLNLGLYPPIPWGSDGRPAAYRPNGRRPNNPGSHWASTRQPRPGSIGGGGNYAGINGKPVGGQTNGRPEVTATRPGTAAPGTANQVTTRPGRYTVNGTTVNGTPSALPTGSQATASAPSKNQSTQQTSGRGSRRDNQTTKSNASSSGYYTYGNEGNLSNSGSSGRYSSGSNRSTSSGTYSSGSKSSSGSSSRYTSGSGSSSGRYSSGGTRSSSGGSRGGGRGGRR